MCSREDEDGNLPLHLAAKVGNLEALDSGLLDDDDDNWDEGEVCTFFLAIYILMPMYIKTKENSDINVRVGQEWGLGCVRMMESTFPLKRQTLFTNSCE